MKLSVLITMYNSCANVAKILRKLHEQIIKAIESVEVIVVDDGSTDTQAKEVDALCTEFDFVYAWQENQGEASARQLSLNLAEGEFITWIDADDDITDDYIEKLLEETALGYDMITHYWINKDGTKPDRHPEPLVNWNVWSNMYRRACVKDVKFNLKRLYSSDYFWLEEAQKKCPKLYHSPNCVNLYENNNYNSLTHRFARGEIKEFKD